MIKVDDRDREEISRLFLSLAEAKDQLAELTLARLQSEAAERAQATAVTNQKNYMRWRLSKLAEKYGISAESLQQYDNEQGAFITTT